MGEQDRHHVVTGPPPFLLREQVRVRVQIRHALAGPRVGHPAAGPGRGPQREGLAGHRRAAGRVELGRGRVIRVLVTDDPVGPVEQQPPVLVGHPQRVGQGQQRQIRGHVLGEVALPAGPAEDPSGDRSRVAADPLFQLGHGARGEGPREHPAEPGVLGRVHVQHHAADVAEGFLAGRVADLGGAQPGGEQLRLLEDGFGVVVAEHEPEPGPARPAVHRALVHPDDGAGVAEAGQRGERHPGHVGGRVEHGLRVAGRGWWRLRGHPWSRNPSIDATSAAGVSNIG